MNILYFCPSESMYGDNIALMRIMPILKERGIIPFFVVAKDGEFANYLRCNNYDYIISDERIWNWYLIHNSIYHWLRTFILCRVINIFKRRRILKELKRIVIKKEINLIHTNCSNSSLGYELSKICGLPHVWHIREYGDLDAFNYYFPSKASFLRKLNSNNNYCIAITPDIKKYLGRCNKCTVIYDGVFSMYGLPEIIFPKEKLFIFVGRITKPKGIECVLDSFIKLGNNHGYKLLVIGDGDKDYVEVLKQKVSSYIDSGKIVFTGYLANVHEMMQIASAIIVASDFEAFGFITSEAMYNGCYVIGKNTAGTKLQLDNVDCKLDNQICSRYSDDYELSSILDDLVKGRIIYNKRTLQITQSRILNLYSIESSGENVYNYYRTILSLNNI